MANKALRESLKALVELSDELAPRLVHIEHLKVGWVSCRVRKKPEISGCYRCHNYGQLAAKCEGSDRTKCCWMWGKKKHSDMDIAPQHQSATCAIKNNKDPRQTILRGPCDFSLTNRQLPCADFGNDSDN